MLSTEMFKFDEFKRRLTKLKRLADPTDKPYSGVNTLNDSSSLTEFEFIMWHYYNFMNDKLSHTEYPRSICELLCYFILRCNNFNFRLEPKALCYNLVDIAENSKNGEVITDEDYSSAISTLLCELITAKWGDLNELLDIFITSIEKDPWHKAVYTVWQRHDPEEKKENEEAKKAYEEWQRKGRIVSYQQKNGGEAAYNERAATDADKLRRIQTSNDFKNEQVRQRALDAFKARFTPAQFEELEKNLSDAGRMV